MFDLDQIESASPYTRSAPDDVCFGSKADIGPHQLNVRFTVGGFNGSTQHLLILLEKEVCDGGDCTNMVHAAAEG